MTVNKMIGINKEQEEIEFNRIKELAEKGDTESQYSMGLHCLYAEDEPANWASPCILPIESVKPYEAGPAAMLSG